MTGPKEFGFHDKWAAKDSKNSDSLDVKVHYIAGNSKVIESETDSKLSGKADSSLRKLPHQPFGASVAALAQTKQLQMHGLEPRYQKDLAFESEAVKSTLAGYTGTCSAAAFMRQQNPLPKISRDPACNRDKSLLTHRVTILQAQLEVQHETSKKLARMCKVLRDEHKKEVEDYRKMIFGLKGTEQRDNLSAEKRHFIEPGIQSNDFPGAVNSCFQTAGRLNFVQRHQSPLKMDCLDSERIRLQEKIQTLQARLSKESIRAIRSKECSRLREAVNHLQTRLSQASARALKAEQRFERLRSEVKAKDAVCEYVTANTNTGEEFTLLESNENLTSPSLDSATLQSQEEKIRSLLDEHVLFVEKCKKLDNIGLEYELKLKEMIDQISKLQISLSEKEKVIELLQKESEKKILIMETDNLQLRETANRFQSENVKLKDSISFQQKEFEILENKLQQIEAENLQLCQCQSAGEQKKETEHPTVIAEGFQRFEEILAEKATESARLQLSLDEVHKKNRMLYSDLQETVFSHQSLQMSFKVACANEKLLESRLQDAERQVSSQAIDLNNIEKENRFLTARLETMKLQYEELEAVLRSLHSCHVESASENKHDETQNDLGKSRKLQVRWKKESPITPNASQSVVAKIDEKGEGEEIGWLESKSSETGPESEKFQNEDMHIEKYRQDIATLKALLCQESEKAKLSIVEALTLSTELCAQKESQARVAQRHSHDILELKQTHTAELEMINTVLVKILAAFSEDLPNFESLISTKLRLGVHGLQNKAGSLKRNLAKQRKTDLELMQLLQDKTSIVQNFTDELALRDYKIKELQDTKTEIEDRMQVAINKLQSFECALMKDMQNEDLEANLQLNSAIQRNQYLESVVLNQNYDIKEGNSRCKQLQSSLMQLAATNAALTNALASLELLHRTEVNRAKMTEDLLVSEQKLRHDAEAFRQMVVQVLETASKSIKLPVNTIFATMEMDMEGEYHRSEGPENIAEIVRTDPFRALKQLMDEREILIGILILPEFQHPKAANTAPSRLKDSVTCSECESLRNEIIKQEEDLVNSQNENEKLKFHILKIGQDLLRNGMIQERMKRELSLARADLAKCSVDIESFRSLQGDLLYEKEGILRENAHLQSLIMELHSSSLNDNDTNDGSNVRNFSAFQNKQCEENANPNETEVLVGLVQKLLKHY